MLEPVHPDELLAAFVKEGLSVTRANVTQFVEEQGIAVKKASNGNRHVRRRR